MSSTTSTKRCAAAACRGMVLASFIGAAGPATAVTHGATHRRAVTAAHLSPDVQQAAVDAQVSSLSD